MDSVTVTQRRQKARQQRNSNGNSNDGNKGSDKDGGDGWRDGDGRRNGDTTEMAAMGGGTVYNRGILNLCSNLFVITSLSICSSQLILV